MSKKNRKYRKFRAMTNGEYCDKWFSKHKYCISSKVASECCPYARSGVCYRGNADKPFVINGKYIFIEVKE